MNVNGRVKVFRNEKDGNVWFNIGDSSKNVDGNYVYKNYNARFKNDEPTDKSRIEIKKGFMTYFKKNDNTIVTTVQVMEWEYVEQQESQSPFQQQSTLEINDEDIPF